MVGHQVRTAKHQKQFPVEPSDRFDDLGAGASEERRERLKRLWWQRADTIDAIHCERDRSLSGAHGHEASRSTGLAANETAHINDRHGDASNDRHAADKVRRARQPLGRERAHCFDDLFDGDSDEMR
jgi:hypothetical protein